MGRIINLRGVVKRRFLLMRGVGGGNMTRNISISSHDGLLRYNTLPFIIQKGFGFVFCEKIMVKLFYLIVKEDGEGSVSF
jgi:hypothetical protein